MFGKFNMTFHSKHNNRKKFKIHSEWICCCSSMKNNPCPLGMLASFKQEAAIRICDKRRTRKQLNLLFCCSFFFSLFLALDIHNPEIYRPLLLFFRFFIPMPCSPPRDPICVYPIKLDRENFSIVIVVSHAVLVSTWLSHHVISLFGVCCHQS